jgi:hypothetical protein
LLTSSAHAAGYSLARLCSALPGGGDGTGPAVGASQFNGRTLMRGVAPLSLLMGVAGLLAWPSAAPASDATYRKEFGHANPNADLLTQLQHANVKMIVCGQALGHQSFTAADVAPGVTLALSALTKREELQAAGYGPVPQEAP